MGERGEDRFITRECIRGVYHDDAVAENWRSLVLISSFFFPRFKIPNIKFPRFTPVDLFFSAVYRGKNSRGRMTRIFPPLPSSSPLFFPPFSLVIASTAVDVGTYLFASRLVDFSSILPRQPVN